MSESGEFFQPITLAIIALVVLGALGLFIWWVRGRGAKDLDQLIKDAEDGKDSGKPLPPDEEDLLPSDEELARVEAGEDEKKNLSESSKTVSFPDEPMAETVKVASDVEEIRGTDRKTWLERLRGGLTNTRQNLFGGLSALFSGGARFDEAFLEKVHETLYRADVGVKTADILIEALRKRFKSGDAAPAWDEARAALIEEIAKLFDINASPVSFPENAPLVILVVGVNGVGKTTSIGKLAAHFLAQDKTVLLAAGDTFRAAAIDQLQVWADRLGVDIVKQNPGSDPAAVAYDAVKAAMARKVDVLLIDTAGRLHSKKELMDELSKIKKVVGRDLPGAPHETWLVIDSTTGQNAVMQVKAFREVCAITGLVVTKLDGTAKGGVVIGVTHEHGLPIRYIGVGEKAADLRGFNPKEFADSVL